MLEMRQVCHNPNAGACSRSVHREIPSGVISGILHLSRSQSCDAREVLIPLPLIGKRRIFGDVPVTVGRRTGGPVAIETSHIGRARDNSVREGIADSSALTDKAANGGRAVHVA